MTSFSSSSLIDAIGREVAGEHYAEGVQSILRKCLKFALGPADRQYSFYNAYASAAAHSAYEPPAWLLALATGAVGGAYNYWARVKHALVEDIEIYAGALRSPLSGAIVELEITDSDLHERGEFTAMLRVGDESLLHKPRDPRAEKMLSTILGRLFPDGSVFIPRIFDASGGRYWQEAIEFGTTSVSDVTLRACGRLIALCQLIGLTDQHSSNVQLVGDSICLVDGETVFHPLATDRQKRVVTQNGSAPVGLTPIITCLLPAWTVDQATKRPQLASTLVGEILGMEEPGKGWCQHVSDGLIVGYAAAMNEIEEIYDQITAVVTSVGDVPLRRVARPTSGYYRLIERAVANVLAANGDNIEGEVQRLLAFAKPAYHVENEAETVASGFIPRCVQSVDADEIVRTIRSNVATMLPLSECNRDVIALSIKSAALDGDRAANLLADRDSYKLTAI